MTKRLIQFFMWLFFTYTLWRLKNFERSLLKESKKDHIAFSRGVESRLQGRSFLNDQLPSTAMFGLLVFYLQLVPFWLISGVTLGTSLEAPVEQLYYFSVCLLVVQVLSWVTSPTYLFAVASNHKSLASKLLAEGHVSMRNWILTVTAIALVFDVALVRFGWLNQFWAGFLIR